MRERARRTEVLGGTCMMGNSCRNRPNYR
jgi:hypothetical protein